MQRSIQMANFNCTFGEDNEPMLTYFENIIYPAFTSGIERKYKESTFLFHNVQLMKIENRLVLAGIMIEKKEIGDNQTKYDEKEKVISRYNETIKLDPISYFGIFLDNHFMYYIKDTGLSPELSKFQSTVRYVLKTYIKEQKESLYARVNITPIPSTNDQLYETLLSDIKCINHLSFPFFPQNPGENGNNIFDKLLGVQDRLESSDPSIKFPQPKNKNEVIEMIKSSQGYAKSQLKITKTDNTKTTYKDTDFEEKTDLELDDDLPANSKIIEKVFSKPTLKKISKKEQEIYDGKYEKLLSHFRDIINIIR